MQYFILPFVLLIYFELLGRYIYYKLNKEASDFSFLLGFVFTMALLYITSWPITAFNGNFYYLTALYLVLFLISLILIIKDIKHLSFKINYQLWLIFFLLLVIEIYISYHRTLGDPHGFDTLYYINTIAFNIGNKELNSLHPHFGTYPNTDVQWITYVFQSYYYFIAVFIYVIRTLLSFIGMSFETVPAIVWIFEIFQEMFYIATTLVCIKEVKSNNKILNLAYLVLLVLFLGNLYYNNVYGFIGNNYRMAIHALSTIYLFRYFKSHDKSDLMLSFVMMEGMCALASTGTFALIFMLYGLFFALCEKEKNLLKYYVLFCYVPTLNILVTKLGQKWYLSIGLFIIFALIYYLNDFILNIFKNKKVRIAFIVLCFILMAGLSFYLTHNIFDFYAFFNNYSEIADMTWDYFMFNDYRHYIFNLICLVPLFYYLFKNKNHPFAIMSWVLIIVIYNPFVCTFMNKVNWVYYRTYDIIINHFTIMYLYNWMIEDSIKSEKIKKISALVLLLTSISLAIIQIPKYYHETFIPDEDYNPIHKIENSELELIRNVEMMIKDYDIKNPKIINQTFFMPAYIENSTYLIGKEKRYNYNQYDEISYQLYLIFFPHDYAYDNFYPQGEVADYEKVKYYLDNCDYDILIIDSNTFFYDKDGNYQQLSAYVEQQGFSKTSYSTAHYDVYYLK